MDNNKKTVSLAGTVLFSISSILVLDSFVSPAIIGVPSITLWLLAAVVFVIPYAMVVAELGSAYPDDGGAVSWVRRAFGEFPAVLSGWACWVHVAIWMPAGFTAFAGWLSLAIFPEMSLILKAVLAVTMCWLIVAIGVRGIDLSVTVSNIMAAVKMVLLLIVGILGVIYGIRFGLANDFSPVCWIPTMGSTMAYAGAIINNLTGLELIGVLGSKIENPKRNFPKMTMITGSAVTFVYIFGTFGVLAAIQAENVDTVDGFVYALKELCRVFGPAQNGVFYVLVFLSAVTLVANMVTWCLGANESFQASGLSQRARLLSHRHEKYGTSDYLYYLMGTVATVLIVLNYSLSGSANDVFWAVFSFSAIIAAIVQLLMFPAAVKLRLTDDIPRPYTIPGGKPGTIVCGVAGFACMCFACVAFLDKDVTGYVFWMQIIGTALTVLSGYLLYRSGKGQITTEGQSGKAGS